MLVAAQQVDGLSGLLQRRPIRLQMTFDSLNIEQIGNFLPALANCIGKCSALAWRKLFLKQTDLVSGHAHNNHTLSHQSLD
jgi:hypothetical protein